MILIILTVLGSYVCVSRGESITLDLSKAVNPNQITLEKKDISNITTHKYICKTGIEISTIIDDKWLIWDGNVQNKRCKLVIAHLFNNLTLYLHIRLLNADDSFGDLYFKKMNGSWSYVEPKELPDYFHFDQTSYSINKDTILDLNSEPSEKLFNVIKSRKYGMNFHTYSPKLGVKVNKVVNNDITIWESGDQANLFQINVSYSGKIPIFVELTLEKAHNSKKLYFENTFDEWVGISRQTYELKHKSHDFHLPLFDIKDLDLNKFIVDKYEVSGINTYVYTPMLGTNVHNVAEGSMAIWESKVGDYVDKIWVYSKGGEFISTDLRIVDSNNAKTINNYKRFKDGWKLVLVDEL